MKLKTILIIVIFLLGLYFCLNYKSSDVIEGYDNNMENCPNLLIKKGKELHLVNTKKPQIPGVNPIRFNSLEDYAEYIAWAQRVGIKCPILYYEQTYDTQNNRGFRMLDDPLNPNAGLASNPSYMQTPTTLLLDSNRDDPPYNQNNFAAFDPNDQDVGNNTPLDNVTLKTDYGSLSAMDDDWCGGKCSQKAVDRGDFSKRTRKILNPIDDDLLKSARSKDSMGVKAQAQSLGMHTNEMNNNPPGPQSINKSKSTSLDQQNALNNNNNNNIDSVYSTNNNEDNNGNNNNSNNNNGNNKCTDGCSIEFERCVAEHSYNKCRKGIDNGGDGRLKSQGCVAFCLDTTNMSNLRISNIDEHKLKPHTHSHIHPNPVADDHIVTDQAVAVYPTAANIDPTSSNANPAAANTDPPIPIVPNPVAAPPTMSMQSSSAQSSSAQSSSAQSSSTQSSSTQNTSSSAVNPTVSTSASKYDIKIVAEPYPDNTYPDLLKFSKGSTNGKPNCPWYVGRKDKRLRKCARDCIQIHPNNPVEQGRCQKDKRHCFKVCASKMS